MRPLLGHVRTRAVFFVSATLISLAVAGCAPGAGTTTSEEAVSVPTAVDTATTATPVTDGPAEVSTTDTSEIPATSTEAPLPTTTTEALSGAERLLPNGHVRAMGYVTMLWEDGAGRHLKIDYAEMLTGEEARQAAVDAGDLAPGEDLPNDYYIRNVGSTVREFLVSDSATVTTDTLGGGPNEPATWADLLSWFGPSPPAGFEYLKEMPWWVERDGDVIVSIAEQYLP
jgi:hypothetical protein